MEAPTFDTERKLIDRGYISIAGIDEVGRGALAGPVAAAALILPVGRRWSWLDEVRDSKQLTPARRERIFELIRDAGIPYGVGYVSHVDIDNMGIVPATKTAMAIAVSQLRLRPDHLLIDALSLPRLRLPQTPLIHGDALSLSIACASIVAKVSRDRLMTLLDRFYPGYGLASNKGYYTREHRLSIMKLGFSSIHRRSFAPFRGLEEI